MESFYFPISDVFGSLLSCRWLHLTVDARPLVIKDRTGIERPSNYGLRAGQPWALGDNVGKERKRLLWSVFTRGPPLCSVESALTPARPGSPGPAEAWTPGPHLLPRISGGSRGVSVPSRLGARAAKRRAHGGVFLSING